MLADILKKREKNATWGRAPGGRVHPRHVHWQRTARGRGLPVLPPHRGPPDWSKHHKAVLDWSKYRVAAPDWSKPPPPPPPPAPNCSLSPESLGRGGPTVNAAPPGHPGGSPVTPGGKRLRRGETSDPPRLGRELEQSGDFAQAENIGSPRDRDQTLNKVEISRISGRGGPKGRRPPGPLAGRD